VNHLINALFRQSLVLALGLFGWMTLNVLAMSYFYQCAITVAGDYITVYM